MQRNTKIPSRDPDEKRSPVKLIGAFSLASFLVDSITALIGHCFGAWPVFLVT